MMVPIKGSEGFNHVCDGKKLKNMDLEVYRHDIHNRLVVNDDKPCRWERDKYGKPVPIIGHKLIYIKFCPFCGKNIDEDMEDFWKGLEKEGKQ